MAGTLVPAGPRADLTAPAPARRKKIRPAEIPRLQREHHVALHAGGAQHRHAGCDLLPDQERRDPQPVHHRADVSPPATTSRRTPRATKPEPTSPSPARSRGRPCRGRAAPALRPQCPRRNCWRSAPDPRRGARRPSRARARPRPVGDQRLRIEPQHRHRSFGRARSAPASPASSCPRGMRPGRRPARRAMTRRRRRTRPRVTSPRARPSPMPDAPTESDDPARPGR